MVESFEEKFLRERLIQIAERLIEEGKTIKKKVELTKEDVPFLAETVAHDLIWLFPNLSIDHIIKEAGKLRNLHLQNKEAKTK